MNAIYAGCGRGSRDIKGAYTRENPVEDDGSYSKEVIDVTDKAKKSIEEVPVWRA